jgi:hypothetical protein
MINKSIDKKTENNQNKSNVESKKPNENNGVYFSSHIKIYDPNTNKVFVQKRADE